MSKNPQLQTISINLPRTLVHRVQSLAFHEDLSASSVIEKSLLHFLDHHNEEALGVRLRELGATLRRA